MTREEHLEHAIRGAVRTAHGARKYAKALRTLERTLLAALGYTTYAEFVRWEGGAK